MNLYSRLGWEKPWLRIATQQGLGQKSLQALADEVLAFCFKLLSSGWHLPVIETEVRFIFCSFSASCPGSQCTFPLPGTHATLLSQEAQLALQSDYAPAGHLLGASVSPANQLAGHRWCFWRIRWGCLDLARLGDVHQIRHLLFSCAAGQQKVPRFLIGNQLQTQVL